MSESQKCGRIKQFYPEPNKVVKSQLITQNIWYNCVCSFHSTPTVSTYTNSSWCTSIFPVTGFNPYICAFSNYTSDVPKRGKSDVADSVCSGICIPYGDGKASLLHQLLCCMIYWPCFTALHPVRPLCHVLYESAVRNLVAPPWSMMHLININRTNTS